MIDLPALLERVDLLALTERDTELRKVATTGGGEYAGPCPFCGGVDRFRVQPYNDSKGRWMCRHCTEGRWRDAVAYVQRRDNVDFLEACKRLGSGDLPTITERREPPPAPAYTPPTESWQDLAWTALDICRKNLETAEPAVDFLLDRGIGANTWERFNLGYCPGAKFGDIYIPRGVVIPCTAGGEIWYFKIALLPGDTVKCEKCGKQVLARHPCPNCGKVNKYRGVKGNRTAAIFNADDLEGAETALFCEGEFDCLTIWQETQGLQPVATLGAATNRLDLATWGAYLVGLHQILVTYDPDQAGKTGAAYWLGLTGRAREIRLPEGVKDINDLLLRGGDVAAWLSLDAEWVR
jgi:DNA primase